MPRKEPPLGAWGVTILLVLGAGELWLRMNRVPESVFQRDPAADAAADIGRGFLMLHMPEITAQHESGVDIMTKRVDDWLESMRRAGFRPMRLSEAAHRAEKGKTLPPRAVVLFFSPGYRRTYEIMGPIFQRRGIPAAWLTSEAACQAADRRYLTYHAMRGMRLRGGWDVGFAFPGGFRIAGDAQPTEGRWSSTAGAGAMNWPDAGGNFRFLNVNADWTADDLIQRLEAEDPALQPSLLSAARIQGRVWGVTRPAGAAGAGGAAFDLEAPPAKRGEKVFWLGTMGRRDFRLHVTGASLIGSLRLQLRADESSGDALDVILTPTDIVVQELRDGQSRRVYNAPREAGDKDRPFMLDIALAGQRLSLSVNGKPAHVFDGLEVSASRRGLVQLFVWDRLRGTAKARDLSLSFAPLADDLPMPARLAQAP